MDKINELIEKIKNGSATSEEELALLEVLNATTDAFKILLQEVKVEQIKQSLKK
jgi:hypothetical protein